MENFCVAVLRHYTVDLAGPVFRKDLLHTRARFFFRTGKLLMSKPPTQFGIDQDFARIEEKYAADLLACKAIAAKPQQHYQGAATVATVPSKSKVAKSKSSGSAFGPLLDVEAEGAPEQEVKEEVPDEHVKHAYQLAVDKMSTLSPVPWASLTCDTWIRLAAHGLMQAHVLHQDGVDGINVLTCEASAPQVYQARALKDFDVGCLVLIPFIAGDLVPFEEGAKLKHPKGLHPHLPYVAEVEAGAFSLDDTHKFFVKSPLSKPPKVPVAPSSFWAVSLAQEPGDENMAETTMDLVFNSMDVKPQYPRGAAPKGAAKQKAKKAKTTPLSVRISVYVNIKRIDRGTVLVRSAALKDDPDQDA